MAHKFDLSWLNNQYGTIEEGPYRGLDFVELARTFARSGQNWSDFMSAIDKWAALGEFENLTFSIRPDLAQDHIQSYGLFKGYLSIDRYQELKDLEWDE